jgi:site-specific DNA-methyltransferase (adenine-specific)
MVSMADVVEGRERWHVQLADCLFAMSCLPDACVDAIVCDPPYDLTANKKGGSGEASVDLDSPYGRARIGAGNGGFMGMDWDATGVAFDPETWRAVLRVAKPGAHLAAFGGTRTSHRMVCAIEDAGWEIRDSLVWLHGVGFPKSLDPVKAAYDSFGPWPSLFPEAYRDAESVAERFAGYGTALKPAHEPIVLARKPFDGTVAGNLLAHGTGALDIAGCRIETAVADLDEMRGRSGASTSNEIYGAGLGLPQWEPAELGRWPANVLLDEEAAALLDAQAGNRPGMSSGGTGARDLSMFGVGGITRPETVRGDDGGPSRFFYTAKASRSERDAGLDAFEPLSGAEATRSKEGQARLDSPRTGAGRGGGSRNMHPTVKPIDLMRWLVRLVAPPGAVVLDPFTGSGTTGIAVLLEQAGRRFLGIERKPVYVRLAEHRIVHYGGGRLRTHEEIAADAAALPEGTRKQLALF